MKRTITFLLFILLASSNSIYGQRVKTAIQGHIRGKHTIIEVKKEYSKEGYLLSEEEPEIYCSFGYKYDDRGRLIELTQVCGESSSNGGTAFEYYPTKVISTESAAGYSRVVCDSFNVDGKLLFSEDTWIDEMGNDGWCRLILTEYIYENQNLIKKERKEINYTDSTHASYKGYFSSDTTIHITTCAYDTLGNLYKSLIVDKKNNDTIELVTIEYAPNTHQKIKESIYQSVNGYHVETTIFRYDANGILIRKEMLEFLEKGSGPYKSNILEYTYKNNRLCLIQEKDTDSPDSWQSKSYYKNDLPLKTVYYNKGKKTSATNYYYTYW